MLTLVDLGRSGSLMFTARWAAPASDVEALRDELAARTASDPGRIRLAFAPVGSPRCSVWVRDETGGQHLLARSTTSGYPPYDAVFSIQLEGADLDAARGSLAGRHDVLSIEYTADLLVPVSSSSRLESAHRAGMTRIDVTEEHVVREPVRAVLDIGEVAGAAPQEPG
jgi:hypothetical protein